MASAPQANLPLFYNDLTPLNSRDHAEWRSRTTDRAKWVVNQHALPLTVEEFPLAQRNFPIVFSNSDKPVPLALMGLNEGVNVFFDDEGKALEEIYVPAYMRRYPFLLAKLQPDTDQMSLCVDPSSGLVGEFDDGEKLFDGDEASDHTKNLLQFCQQFEEAGMRTQQFIDELQKHDLLMDGEVSISRGADEQPFTYRGFKMVNQEKLRELTGDQLRKWNQNGLLPLIQAHLFSLDLMRTVFARQVEAGKGPVKAAADSAALGADATKDA
ncbi:SapC family protein [Paraurantiacibacter namhicola]|uniref:SapC n=1 Tax=Paraurantiacibacter namhicola TaxID=645517 RepID=A0A1C7D8E5_9SPHN|nr:SapC family protein [Paraurantiacibacter namhicola]ANU07717.1 SapC [Paraurantiacibacter namhicola]